MKRFRTALTAEGVWRGALSERRLLSLDCERTSMATLTLSDYHDQIFYPLLQNLASVLPLFRRPREIDDRHIPSICRPCKTSGDSLPRPYCSAISTLCFSGQSAWYEGISDRTGPLSFTTRRSRLDASLSFSSFQTLFCPTNRAVVITLSPRSQCPDQQLVEVVRNVH